MAATESRLAVPSLSNLELANNEMYRAKDLEGHHWEFSQRGRDLDATEWRLPPGLKRGVHG